MLVVAHLSDLHLGAHEPAAVASIAADVAACRPSLTVVTGDCTMRARHREFRQVRRLLARLPRPLLVVPGNHDVPLVSPERLLRPYGRYESWIDVSPRPIANVLGLTAMGLRSMPWWRWKSGFVSARQTQEVVRVLGGAPEGDVRVLALHHPPFATGAAALVGRGRLARALTEARVDVVLAGHTHVPEVQTVDGRPLVVIAGTATSLRIRNVPRSWSQLRITADSIEVRERYASDDGTWYTGRVVRQSDGRRLRAGRRPQA
ncbi:metallophosphoesterase family protein [Paractinoplanes rishiriensis]|uniref:Metallophosphoesterase n=1 Tax=Paractinoplanes rishiriensis TaxID=1050105 RepID=A0A919K876_9ACTN|nr:metallophosphoesterase [Actinoplanes rishiriensis]GIF00676.1 metallophosphoesterase [Actinoplanes rishiriensis]